MAISNRAAIIKTTFKVLKKHYDPIPAATDRTLLEHLLYASLLENSPYDRADEAFTRLRELYFDWNEVRVTTVTELAEVLTVLATPAAAATRLKLTLQGIFEQYYSFDLEAMKKQNIGKSVKQLAKHKGITPFAVAYVTQHALAGHSIPVCEGALKVMYAVGAVSDTEREKRHIPGMDRAIPKSKGKEFASLLHQAGAELFASPFSLSIRAILTEIAPDAKSRMPKRRKRKMPNTGSEKAASKGKKAAKNAPAKKKAPAKKAGAGKKKSATKQLTKRKPR